MTKKELNKIQTAAYAAFLETDSGKEFLATPAICCKCWGVEEGEKKTLLITYHDTQLNNETLKAIGHSPEASAQLLFSANKQTKTLTPAEWD